MKKHLFLRTISLLAALGAVILLASCASSGDGGDTGDLPPVTDDTTAAPDDGPARVPDGAEEAKKYADALVASLPDRKFAKDSFTVATAPGIDLAPEEPADGYEDALIERNATVKNKYGVSVRAIETPLDLMLSDAYSAYLSGTFYADALMIPQSAVGEFFQKGFLLSAYSLPHIEYDREYFDSDAMDQASGGYSAPVIAGAATKDPGSYYCIYVNTALLGEDATADLCMSVRDGGWTWDKLLETARSISDLNGEVKIIGSKSPGILTDTVYLSSGQHYLDASFGKVPTMAFETAATEKVIALLRDMNDAGAVFDTAEGGEEIDRFVNGDILFHADTVDNMEKVSRMGADWCALPVPKTDPNEAAYVSYCSPDAPVMVVPAGNPDTEDAAYAIEALNAASYKYLDRCYYHRVVRTALNSSRTLDMLEYVYGINGGVGAYDFTAMYGGVFPQLAFNTTETVWELATVGGDLAEAAYNSRFDMNWRLTDAFPVKKQ